MPRLVNGRWCRYYSAIATSGIQGVEGRVPFTSSLAFNGEARSGNLPDNRSVSITDPYTIYQNYITQGILEKDCSQIRVMKEFQKLYHRVSDYVPPEEMSIRLSLLLREIEMRQVQLKEYNLSPLKYFRRSPEKTKKSMVKYMTDEEELANFASPRGLLINGDVGSGKSLLMDIFASSLPYKSKMRWHYNNFILWVFNEMHKIQQHRFRTMNNNNNNNNNNGGSGRGAKYTMENEFILYEVAQKMIQKNTVLMLDEFVLPDIASANIIKILFTFFFRLGGVLVATSNKLPEELYSTDFNKLKFKSFVGILNSRCMSVDMKSGKDYRTYFASESKQKPYLVIRRDNEKNEQEWQELIKTKALEIPLDSPMMQQSLASIGKPSKIIVYNRTTKIPLTFQNNSICYLDFEDICQGLTSSSDYITIASTYKIIILDNVPIMTTKKKNEARRFITLIDAIYEAKCQFFMRSQVGIDYLFFPDALNTTDVKFMEYLKIHLKSEGNKDQLEVQDEEMFAKTSIAMMNPYRPNIASYDSESTESYSEEKSIRKGDFTTPASNYSNIKVFTGDDEKFAFKRAVSRIKEMVGSDLWRKHNRWVPVDESMRPWENVAVETSKGKASDTTTETSLDTLLREKSIKEITQELSQALPRQYSENENIPFRLFNARIAPIFYNLSHFWAMGPWTNEQGKRLKDAISKSWIRSSIRNDKP
ncbi:hypothetical protein KGF56_001925 [Candida oxycetoniae]|uniref:Uncharacterized protein n=1 Tax=Candida oxycetoniae TaxID=497107 RepID=A0AAI9SYJ2_9ASCO|nr:uncharacterized protein KGF56_001925 [Candida oxycetoniae]KAI3405268.2 hypothetical protein KGF56_001925 [Candida oxycetoniae]